MAWNLVWTERATRDISKIDPTAAKRIITKLETTLPQPNRYLKRLVGEDAWRLRVGDYRIICVLSFDTETIIVQKVGHRSAVYGGEE